ncbi:MAG: hypothetical protein HOP28_18295 [Gemmatimonadales bacterium]|nr:hypothetical protein [Gemmatimonadales bacterium]
MAEPAAAAAPVTSDLEAGRPVAAKVAPAAPRTVQVRSAAAVLVEALAEAPAVFPTVSAEVEQPLESVPIPESHTVYLAPTGTIEEATPIHVAAGTSLGGNPHIGHDYGGSRGPSIIIRGGMGGIDDKCDLRPRVGTAVNRLVPPIGVRGGFARGGMR